MHASGNDNHSFISAMSDLDVVCYPKPSLSISYHPDDIICAMSDPEVGCYPMPSLSPIILMISYASMCNTSFMSSMHVVLCHPLSLFPSIFPVLTTLPNTPLLITSPKNLNRVLYILVSSILFRTILLNTSSFVAWPNVASQ